MSRFLVTGAKRVLLNIPVVQTFMPVEQFRTQGFLQIKSTAVQRWAGKNTTFAS